MRNRLNTMDELMATSHHASGGETRDGDDDLLMSASACRVHGEKAVHVQLRTKALSVSSTASCVANMLFVWAWWAVFRLRKAWGVVVASTRESGSALAGLDCATGSEEGLCLDTSEDSLVLALESGVGSPWKDKWKENWAPMSRLAIASTNTESSTLDTFGEQRQRDGQVGKSWPCNSSIGGVGGPWFATPEPSPPTTNTLIHSACDAGIVTTPALPKKRKRMFGNAGVNCNLCGYTLGEGDEVVRAPSCGEGFMVRAMGGNRIQGENTARFSLLKERTRLQYPFVT